MSDEDHVEDVLERLEWVDGRSEGGPPKRWLEMTRRTALSGGAAGIAALVLEACGGSSKPKSTASAEQGGTPASGVFGASEKYKFVFVNHVTTNPFFVPTKYGAEDACKLLGCSYQWTGSQSA